MVERGSSSNAMAPLVIAGSGKPSVKQLVCIHVLVSTPVMLLWDVSARNGPAGAGIGQWRHWGGGHPDGWQVSSGLGRIDRSRCMGSGSGEKSWDLYPVLLVWAAAARGVDAAAAVRLALVVVLAGCLLGRG